MNKFFKAGDYVQRAEECRDLWWKSCCKETYNKPYDGVFRVTGTEKDDSGDFCIKLEGFRMKWQSWRFDCVSTKIPFNKTDYL